MDLDADEENADDIHSLPPPSWVREYHNIILSRQQEHSRLAAQRATSYDNLATTSTRAQSEERAATESNDVIMVESSAQSSDSDIKINDPDVEIACDADTGEAT